MSDFKTFMFSGVITELAGQIFFLFPAGLEQLHAALVSGRGHQDGPMGRQLSAATQWLRPETGFTAAAVLGPQWRASLHRQSRDRHW